MKNYILLYLVSALPLFSLKGYAQNTDTSLQPPDRNWFFDKEFIQEEKDGVLIYRWKRTLELVDRYVKIPCEIDGEGGIYRGNESEGLLVKGLRHGNWKIRNCYKGVQHEMHYKNGLLHGVYKIYTRRFTTGTGWYQTIYYQTEFSEGTGLWKDYYHQGLLKQCGNYVNGKKDGEWLYYTQKGHFLYKREWYEKGVLQREEIYEVPPEFIEVFFEE